MKWFKSSAALTPKTVCLFAFCTSLLIMRETVVSAADLNYVTGGSIDLGFGTSKIHVRKNSDGDNALYLTFGGPAMKLSFPDMGFNVSASFFPSLRFLPNPDTGTNNFSLVLGFGPSFGYENWIVALPIFFPDARTTDVAIAVGYSL